MRITDCADAPQWLRDARTENADVSIIDGTVVWKSGTWQRGTWRGGTWRGGDWRGGTWRGEKLSTNLLTIYGLTWPVTISPTRIQIGCELHTIEEWRGFDDATIVKMDRWALKFWRAHGAALLALAMREGK